jgi:hypothetical protein
MPTKQVQLMGEKRGLGPTVQLPTSGSQLPDLLHAIMEAETGAADRAVNEALDGVVLKEFETWFEVRPRELDQAMLKKIRNSASSAGSQGDKRTLEALLSMNIWPPRKKKISVEDAAQEIRTATQELRRAKTYLFHQAKCIRSVISFIGEEMPESKQRALRIEIDSLADFKKWGEEVWRNWREKSTMDMKNRLMVSNFWMVFIETFSQGDQFILSKYGETLRSKVKEYLSPDEFASIFERALLSNLDAMLPNSNSVKNDFTVKDQNFQVDTKISGQIVSIIFRLDTWTESMINKSKIGLAFELSGDPSFEGLDLAVTSAQGLHPELRVSMNKPKKPDVLEYLAKRVISYLSIQK